MGDHRTGEESRLDDICQAIDCLHGRLLDNNKEVEALLTQIRDLLQKLVEVSGPPLNVNHPPRPFYPKD